MAANFEDISVVWGGARDPHDQVWSKWWRAVYQDMEPSWDGNRLYFLYDPVGDEDSGSSGGRKGNPSILVFDTVNKKFFREIPVNISEKTGLLKNFFLVNPATNTFCLITDRKEEKMTIWHLQLTPDGLNVASGPTQLFGPIKWDTDYMYVLRDDVPEIVYLSGPGLTVWRVNPFTPGSRPIDHYKVQGGNIETYYDAVCWHGKVYIMGCNDDESFDFYNLTRNLQRCGTRPDPVAGYPSNRKQCGLDRCGGSLYLTGGENDGYGGVTRFQDMWSLDLSSLTWQKHNEMQLNLPLIEPRLSCMQNGLVHVWGDCDIPQGCLAPPTHLHVLKTWLRNIETPPPTYDAATGPPPYVFPEAQGIPPPAYPGASAPPMGASGTEKQPAYMNNGGYGDQQPGSSGYPPQQGGSGYPQQGGAYPPQQGGGYPQQGGGYPQQGGGYPQQGGGGYPPQQGGGYPPQQDGDGGKKKDKDCSIS